MFILRGDERGCHTCPSTMRFYHESKFPWPSRTQGTYALNVTSHGGCRSSAWAYCRSAGDEYPGIDPMKGWNSHQGKAVILAIDNIDTDQLIPARFMSQPRHAGYGQYLLFDLRRNDQQQLDPVFPLNQSNDASILITGSNFGCGSSREAAVYALVDAGITAVIAPSFGDIFAANAVNNGLLPALMNEAQINQLTQLYTSKECSLMINLETCTVSMEHTPYPFVLDQTWRLKLINGWDDIDLTKQYNDDINKFKTEYLQKNPWINPRCAEILQHHR